MKKQDIISMFSALRAANPDPKTELNYTSPFTLLVAVILSAQATDKGVNRATERLFSVADTPKKLLALGLDGVTEHVKTLNFYKTKAKNVYAMAEALVAHYEGNVPDTRAALVTLPGVGRKTANVVLNAAFGQPTMAVDTHVFRVANRTGLAAGETPEEVEAELERVVPPEFAQHAHHWLILHGRYVCTARAPKCEICVISPWCKMYKK